MKIFNYILAQNLVTLSCWCSRDQYISLKNGQKLLHVKCVIVWSDPRNVRFSWSGRSAGKRNLTHISVFKPSALVKKLFFTNVPTLDLTSFSSRNIRFSLSGLALNTCLYCRSTQELDGRTLTWPGTEPIHTGAYWWYTEQIWDNRKIVWWYLNAWLSIHSIHRTLVYTTYKW